MKTIQTVCPRDCYSTCSLEAQIDDNGWLVKLSGSSENPVTRGFTCMRSPKDPERVYKNRILYPQIRNGSKPGRNFTRASWKEAFDTVSRQINTVLDRWGPEKLLLVHYAGNMGLLVEQFSQRLWKALGATETDHSICSLSGHAGLELHYGLGYGLQPEQLVNQNLILFWGFNPVVSAPHIWALANDARKQHGALIAVIDSRRSETAKKADLWIAPRPETDVALANGIANHLIQQNQIDGEFINAWTIGFDMYKEQVEKWTLEKTAAATGVQGRRIEKLAQVYGEHRPSATMIGIGFQKSNQGAQAVRAVSLLPSLIGQHRGFFYGNSSGIDVDTNYLTGQSLVRKSPKMTSQVALSDAVLAGEFKFIYVYGTNPALTLPNQTALRRGLVKSDVFMVVHDPHWNETIEFADVVLPATSYLEKEDIVVPWSHWHVRKSNRVIAPLGESKDEIEVMLGLAKRLNTGSEMVYEPPWEALEKAFDGALAKDTFQQLLDGNQVQMKYKPLDEYQTSSGKIEFVSESDGKKGSTDFPYFEPTKTGPDEYLLLNSAVREYTHTQFQDIFGPIPAIVWINPQDAEKNGIKNNDEVFLTNTLGKINASTQITDDVPVGVLWSPKQFPGKNGVPFNTVCPSTPQHLGGGPVFNSTVVRIESV